MTSEFSPEGVGHPEDIQGKGMLLREWKIYRPVHLGYFHWVMGGLVAFLIIGRLAITHTEGSAGGAATFFEFFSVAVPFGWIFTFHPYVYVYRISSEGGELQHWLHSPNWLGTFGVVVAVIYVFLAIAAVAVTGSIGMLAGSAILGFLIALKLAGYEPPEPEREDVLWSKCDLILVDRRRKMVVAGYKDQPMLGFVMLVRRKELDALVDLMRTVMPAAECREQGWEWHR